MTAGPTLRLAILVPAAGLRAWQVGCIGALRGLAEIVLWVETAAPGPPSPPPCPLRGALFGLYWRRAARRSRALRPAAAPPAMADVPRVPAGAEAAFAGHRLDAIVDLSGDADLPDRLGDATRLGLWRLWHGSPAGSGSLGTYFDPSAGHRSVLRLAVLACREGGAALLFEGHFRCGPSAIRNLDRVLMGAATCLAAAAARAPAASTAALLPPLVRDSSPRLSTAAALRFLLGQARALGGIVRSLFELQIWNIGRLDGRAESVLQGIAWTRIQWMPEPPARRYYADPMVLPSRVGGGPILAEEFDYRTGRGRICAIDPTGWRVSVPAGLDTGLHMSFPFLIDRDGQVLCLPESAETGDLRLFRAESYPDRWREEGSLMAGFPAVDAALFEHAGRWWLLSGRRGSYSDAELFAWHAQHPAGPWQPHRLNPLKCDVRSSRPAGPPFVADGVLYRPAQDCSRTYGGALVINRVLALDPESFREEVAIRIAPDPAGPYPEGIHTLCGDGERLFIDGKRLRLHPLAPAMKLWAGHAHRRARRRLAGAAAGEE